MKRMHESGAANVFVWPVRVYWEDTDAGGIVYYANYLKFMERARTEWLRAVGIEQTPLKEAEGLIFVVVDIEAHYRQPARYGEMLRVTCAIDETTRASLTFKQEIHRQQDPLGEGGGGGQDGPGDLLLDGRVRVACLDANTYRPRPLPKRLLEGLMQERNE